VRYRKRLRRLPKYELTAGKIPWSKKRLFLGRGFAWGQRHVQRLVEVRSPLGQSLLEPGPVYRAARTLEVLAERWRILSPLARFTSWDSPLNPVRPLPPVGGDPALHGIGSDEERDVWLDLRAREGHMIVLGTTGVGKTSVSRRSRNATTR